MVNHIENEKVCVVIVTFNRLDLLKECVHSVQNQSSKIDKIIIINNGSSDGTKEWLESIESETIQIITQENSGGAGGFYSGVKLAYEQGFDWVWMMDDDVEVEKDCLYELLKYQNLSLCLHPCKQYVDGKIFKWEQIYDAYLGKVMLLNNMSFENGKDICFVNVGCFEGMLIHSTIIDKIGFPNKEYFICGDDLEYGFLANLYTNVSYVKNARMIRKKHSVDELPSLTSYYYNIRNRFLLIKLIKYIDKNHKSYRGFNRNTIKIIRVEIKKIMKSNEALGQKIQKIKYLIKGYQDGKNNKFGKGV